MIGQGKISSFFKPTSQKRPISTEKENTTPKKLKATDDKADQGNVSLSPEQKQRIEENRRKALEKLSSKSSDGLQSLVGPTWYKALAPEFSKPYFIQLSQFVAAEREKVTVYPPADEVFTWTNTCPINQVKVVILGQDPYHGVRQAHGLCFSVKKGVAPPPSLVNMYKELENDIEGFKRPDHGNLTGWATQGVLLLNAVLTVRAHNANSHKDKGWEKFTDAVIRTLNTSQTNVVFMLWGSYAQKKGACIDKKKHHVLKTVHPSPLSAHRGFFGCKHFSQANEFLKSNGKKPIDWTHLP
ncbi:uracil-DNA glycosylase-like [Liolophura sinensis]|uniref:uracil-DNA glycosylase-like n=1 Tax=Liolophura sinensis TaxID=3198878 RepID=UPI0031596C6F